ncbi:unnamed protein product [Brassica oleracea]
MIKIVGQLTLLILCCTDNKKNKSFEINSRKTQRQRPKIKRESRQHTTPMTAAAINNTQHR